MPGYDEIYKQSKLRQSAQRHGEWECISRTPILHGVKILEVIWRLKIKKDSKVSP